MKPVSKGLFQFLHDTPAQRDNLISLTELKAVILQSNWCQTGKTLLKSCASMRKLKRVKDHH